MRLGNSYVKHYNIFGTGKRYVEGRDNNVRGILRGSRFRLRLINSFGDKTSIIGRTKRIGPIRFYVATAYGYVHKPAGLTMFGVSCGTKHTEYFVFPAGIHKFLFVVLDKEV